MPGARFPAATIATIAKNGALRVRAGSEPHRFLAIWAVVVDGRVFVRSWNDKRDGWNRAWKADRKGVILVGTREMRVRARPMRGERLLDRVSAAYLEKYQSPGSVKFARGLGSPKRRGTTLELLPA